jgi:hypothetical protein
MIGAGLQTHHDVIAHLSMSQQHRWISWAPLVPAPALRLSADGELTTATKG